MSALPTSDVARDPVVLHVLPGRLRVHLPEWTGHGRRALESELRGVDGVRTARANPMTGNVVIEFDPRVARQGAILHALGEFKAPVPVEPAPRSVPTATPPPAQRERRGDMQRARIAVRGLDRDPRMARRIEQHLMRRPGVEARANPLTGRVLVNFSRDAVKLADLVEDISDIELPPLPDEERPTHPLDTGPIVRGMTRSVGAALGLGLLSARRLSGAFGPVGGSTRPAEIAAVIGLLQSFPAVRNLLRRLLGHTAAEVLLSSVGTASLTLAGSPAGLAVSGAEGLRSSTDAMARRGAWRRYEGMEERAASALPGATIRLDASDRTPRAAIVREGTGTAVGRDGLPVPVVPGAIVPAGAMLYGGPFSLELLEGEPFMPLSRQERPATAHFERYLNAAGLASLAYAVGIGFATRSFGRALEALLLVNPRTAALGADAAEHGAMARAIRGGAIAVMTRPERRMRRADWLLIDGARAFCDGWEIGGVLPLRDGMTSFEISTLAARISRGAGSPWGRAFPSSGPSGSDGSFDGSTARAVIDGVTYLLGPPAADRNVTGVRRLQEHGSYVLALRRDEEERPFGLVALQPKLASGSTELIQICRRHGVEIRLVQSDGDERVTAAIARRLEIAVTEEPELVAAIQSAQAGGKVVDVLSDSVDAAQAFSLCDMAIGLTDGRSHFPARADLLAPDLGAVAAIVDACVRRDLSVRDSVGLSVISNIAGAVWGLRGRPGILRASNVFYGAAIAALALGWLRLSGGKRTSSSLSRVVDPHPERWGRQSPSDVLRLLETSSEGLSQAEALSRAVAPARTSERGALLGPFLDQVRSPLIGILAGGAGLSLMIGSPIDVALIGAVIVANVAIGAWQERQAGRAVEELERMGTASARVLRDGVPTIVPSKQLVPGDVLQLAAGDRVAADARLLDAQGLEVDEASLTGESLPVSKQPAGGDETGRVVLEGSDVIAGNGHAVVVAVGAGTRMGAMAAALELEEEPASPLGTRLSSMLKVVMPIAVAGGALVAGAGILRRQPLLQPLSLGTSIAVAAVPEGLPLLAKMGEAAVARRLAGEQALVRRLSSVEALGRVDVACADKTGTLTEGRLSLSLIADAGTEASTSEALSPELEHVLLIGALASPRPDGSDIDVHPTDAAIVNGALNQGFRRRLVVERTAESPFEPGRSFHAVVADGYLCVKGAPEVLVDRCVRVRREGVDAELDDDGRQQLLDRAHAFAEHGLRVLMVAQGDPTSASRDPQNLVALGFLGIRDPLKPAVRPAIEQCRQAGIRAVMLTGDHPATARAIAQEAGLLDGGGEVITATEIAELDADQVADRLDRATVIARATPLDKLRIVESLQRHGHVVAMTGDGANDGPALRLADVGVAMGRGTEVARQASDVVLVDDDFSTLVEALIEGRVFWRNIRRALSLLLGGNLGELGLLVIPSLLGLRHPLNTRQILAVNMLSDVLPALTIALQRPEQRRLDQLAREGTAALERPLRLDILRRGIATGAPSLAAYLLALHGGNAQQAAGVAFASIVATQLAQSLDLGCAEGRPSLAVIGSVIASAGMLAAALMVPPAPVLLGLTSPSLGGWLLVGAASLGAVLLSRLLAAWTDRHQLAAGAGDRDMVGRTAMAPAGI